MINSFVQRIFKKGHEEISIDDLKDFFSSPQEETSILEFKSGQVEIEDLYKEIAAFLNTEGGLIIVGAPKETKVDVGKNKIIRCQGELTYSKFRNKDWLSQKIATNIAPSPAGIKIVEFHLESGAVFLIDIKQSITPPHQVSSEGRYYIRMESEAKPAPHGLVQALFDKRSKPQLYAKLKIEKGNDLEDYALVSFHNNSKVPADKVSVYIDIYNVHQVESKYNFEHYLDDELGKKFSFNKNTDQVLVRVISFPIDFTVIHNKSKYLICASYWSKETDYNFNFWTYDPITRKITNQGEFENSDLSLIDAIKKLKFA